MDFLNRRNSAAVVAEIMGTAVLTGTILAVSRSAIGVPYFVALGVGLAMAMLVLLVGNASGAHVNPAVTVGLWSARKVSTVRALVYIAAQFLGALAAYSLYNYLVPTGLQNIAGPEFEWPVLVAELVGTFVFTFGVAAAVFNGYEGGQKAATIGGSLAVGIIIAGIASNGILNPAAALGVDSWSKAYVIGPLIGGVIGMNLFALLFAKEPGFLARTVAKTQKTAKKVTKR
jgi:glycerol uptake facilitator-like aquaporin